MGIDRSSCNCHCSIITVCSSQKGDELALNKYVKKFDKTPILVISIACLVVVEFSLVKFARAAITPPLGAATTYGILANTYVNTTAGTTVNGDVGFTTGPAVAPADVVDPMAVTHINPLVPIVERESDIGVSDFMSHIGQFEAFTGEDRRLPPVAKKDDVAEKNVGAGQGGVPSSSEGKPTGVLVFGIDGYDGMIQRYGRPIADRVVMKFSALLASKVRGGESIMQLADGRIAIISLTADRDQCRKFAGRICAALATASISVAGERVATTVSAGGATVPEESGENSVEDLLRLATSRLELAVHEGGNRVFFGLERSKDKLGQEDSFHA